MWTGLRWRSDQWTLSWKAQSPSIWSNQPQTRRPLLQALSLCPPFSRGWLFLERWLISLEPVVWGSPLANYNRVWRVYFCCKMGTGRTLWVILIPWQVSAVACYFTSHPLPTPLALGACVEWPLPSPTSSLAAFPESGLKENTVSVCTTHVPASWASCGVSKPHATVRRQNQGLSTAVSTPDNCPEWTGDPAPVMTQSLSYTKLFSPWKVLLTQCWDNTESMCWKGP